MMILSCGLELLNFESTLSTTDLRIFSEFSASCESFVDECSIRVSGRSELIGLFWHIDGGRNTLQSPLVVQHRHLNRIA